MKLKDFAAQYGVNEQAFLEYMRRSQYKSYLKEGFTTTIADNIPPQVLIEDFRRYLAQKNEEVRLQAERAQQAAVEEAKKRKALAGMLISSGFNFDGYKIVKYSGYISGDDCVTLPRNSFWSGSKVEENLCGALVKIRRKAIQELKEAAYDLGCNAIIGVDFDYMTMDPQHAGALNAGITVYEPYVICVTANGNAVVIERDEK